MKQITLTTAVLAATKNFRDDIFSIYNITRSIREDVESGDYEIVGSGRTVLHDEVKAAFLELMEHVYGNEYQTRDSGRGYREFQRISKTQAAQCSAPGCSNTATTSCAAPACPQVAPQTSQTTSSFPNDVKKSITDYLSKNGPRTMKQIQSRLKGFSCTCEDLATYLGNLGLVDKSTTNNAPSKVQAKV